MEDLKGEDLLIDIPAGTQPTEQLHLAGEGMPHLRTEGRGDLYAHVQVVVPTDIDERTRELLEQIRTHRAEAPASTARTTRTAGSSPA